MSELLKINVNDHTERKNNLTYLSWAWAWAEVLKIDPLATWDAFEFDGAPVKFLPDSSAMVKTAVKIKGHTKTCWLPVMDHRNKAIKNPDAFAINTAIVRCLTKTISMHGLGLYIYAGEDLPEGEEPPAPKKDPTIPARPKTEDLGLDAETIQFIESLVVDVEGMCNDGDAQQALRTYRAAGIEGDMHIAFQNMISSKTRSALRKASEELKAQKQA